jgi:hypothetical protein
MQETNRHRLISPPCQRQTPDPTTDPVILVGPNEAFCDRSQKSHNNNRKVMKLSFVFRCCCFFPPLLYVNNTMISNMKLVLVLSTNDTHTPKLNFDPGHAALPAAVEHNSVTWPGCAGADR